MEEQKISLHRIWSPISALYGIGVFLRNKFFDWGILPSEEFDIPIISVGNITVGGTGKTPHTEYLIRLFSSDRIAVLSRGYKRKTRGFFLAKENSTASELGDEPFQIKQKFPNVMVAVDSDRRNGIRKLMKLEPQIDLILLDDAFQHRYVTPSISILLIDYNRMIYEDKLLPVGRLREQINGIYRANIVMITKCPEGIKPMDYRIMAKYLDLFAHQDLYFSSFKYDELIPVFPQEISYHESMGKVKPSDKLLVITGIASPQTLIKHIQRYTLNISHIQYSDHHDFTKKDLKRIEESFKNPKESAKFILVTEKDAARLVNNKHVSAELKQYLYYLPLKVEILQNLENTFNSKMIDYVKKNRRNSCLLK